MEIAYVVLLNVERLAMQNQNTTQDMHPELIEELANWNIEANAFEDKGHSNELLSMASNFDLKSYDAVFWNLHDSSSLAQVQCKCCSGEANIIGLVDFNKSCHDRHGKPAFGPSGATVPYHRCVSCCFIFSIYCDAWRANHFTKHIYNDDYGKADGVIPGFEQGATNPKKSISYINGKNLINRLGISSDQGLKVLDFGSSGNPGLTGLAFLDYGFNLQSYEPYLNETVTNIGEQSFDIIYAIEVIEHVVDLDEALIFFDKHLSINGLLCLQTLIHPHPSNDEIINSWYVAPRNGHFSIFTQCALEKLFQRVGINIISTSAGIFGFKDKPHFQNSIITPVKK